MDMNMCNVNPLDADALLPPRKRLLAGLRRQNSDVNSLVSSPPSIHSSIVGENRNNRNIHGCRIGDPNLSDEDIVEASRIAAIDAARVAEAARANAEEKAAKAAKAVAAARAALEFVAALSEGDENREKITKKNKMKKHVPVEALYDSNKGRTSCGTDEELARKLHRVINSSPRNLKNSSGSDSKMHRHKRLKTCASTGMGNLASIAIGNGNTNSIVKEVGTNNPMNKIDTITIDLSMVKPGKGDWVNSDNGYRPNLVQGEAETRLSKNKFAKTKSLDGFGKKRGRIKQKKLPLSICNFRDRSSPKEGMMKKSRGMSRLEDNQSVLSMWKCQSLKAGVKQNKTMQS